MSDKKEPKDLPVPLAQHSLTIEASSKEEALEKFHASMGYEPVLNADGTPMLIGGKQVYKFPEPTEAEKAEYAAMLAADPALAAQVQEMADKLIAQIKMNMDKKPGNA